MEYLVRNGSAAPIPCDADSALALLGQQDGSYISRFGTNQWITGKAFLEYGEIAFENREFRVLVQSTDPNKTPLLITTEAFPPFAISARLGVVCAEKVATIHLINDLKIGVSDLTGAASATLEREIAKARTNALSEVKSLAASRGAQAIIGLSYNLQPFDARSTMMVIVQCYGTAVTFAAEAAF